MLPYAPQQVSASTQQTLPLQVQHPPAGWSRRRSHDRPPLSPLASSSSSSAAAAAAAPAALELGWKERAADQTDAHMHEDSTAQAQLMLTEMPPPLQPQPDELSLATAGLELEMEPGCGDGAGAVAVHPAFQRWQYQFSGGLAGKGAYGECWRGIALDGRGTAVVLKRLYVQLGDAVQLQVRVVSGREYVIDTLDLWRCRHVVMG